MAPELSDDLRLTHAYLNTLHAGFQGSYVSLNVLGRSGYGGPMHGALEPAKRILEDIMGLSAEMWGGTPILKKGVEPDAKGSMVLELFAIHKKELLTVLALTHKALETIKEQADADSAKLIAASLARHSYAREHFIKGLVKFGEIFGKEEVADRWRQHLLSLQRDIRFANNIFGHLMEDKELDAPFRVTLWANSVGLPQIFAQQLGDLSSVEELYGVPYTYKRLGISEEASASYEAAGIAPPEAGSWLAYGIFAEEALIWKEFGFGSAAQAGPWRVRDFNFEEAVEWANAGFNAINAYLERAKTKPDQ